MSNKTINFEKSLKRLEEIADKLEEGNIPLEESVILFEEGMTLSKYCEKVLTSAEQKIDTINSFELPDDFSFEVKEEVPKKIKANRKDKAESKDVVDQAEEEFLF